MRQIMCCMVMRTLSYNKIILRVQSSPAAQLLLLFTSPGRGAGAVCFLFGVDVAIK